MIVSEHKVDEKRKVRSLYLALIGFMLTGCARTRLIEIKHKISKTLDSVYRGCSILVGSILTRCARIETIVIKHKVYKKNLNSTAAVYPRQSQLDQVCQDRGDCVRGKIQDLVAKLLVKFSIEFLIIQGKIQQESFLNTFFSYINACCLAHKLSLNRKINFRSKISKRKDK